MEIAYFKGVPRKNGYNQENINELCIFIIYRGYQR